MSDFKLPKRYQKTKQQNSGGFGDVIICNDTHLDRLVAIKFIKDPNDMPRMHDEINALLKLSSKHVVQLFDIIKYEEQLGIVEEFIPGPDLIAYTDSITDLKCLIKTLWQIASGIADIHKHEIVHRDIKPNNIKIDGEGIVKIYDFGLSRNNDNAATIGFKGTPIFAAPELILKDTEEVNFNSSVDTFAFGVTALCLAKVPVPPELKTLTKKILQNPFSQSEFKIPKSLQRILFRCLSSEPKERPQMSDVRELLQRQLLKNSHRALLIHNNSQHIIDSQNNGVTIKKNNIGDVQIAYNGYEFYIQSLNGEVSVNNRKPDINEILPDSCVIIIGNSHRPRRERSVITFDISHPEVVL